MASNHDIGRFPSRWCGGDERKIRLALLVLATLPGTTVLYYGDEIGMADVDVPPALRRDTATLSGGTRGNRDRARTPMPWDGSPGGGFTGPGVTPWLPMADPPVRTLPAPGGTTPPNPLANRTVADQRDQPESTLSLCRRLLALRRAELGRGLAGFENLAVTEDIWAYRTGSLVVAANFTDHPAEMPAAVLGAEAGKVLLSTSAEEAPPSPGILRPWEGVIVRVQ
jgi:alpha-glucosidase